jgi:predicted DNA-binding transcriptional regulator AlpA
MASAEFPSPDGPGGLTLDDVMLERLAEAIAERLAERLHTSAQRLLDRPQLAAFLGISERTISALVQRQELPSGYLLGGARRWDLAEVMRYLTARAQRRRRRGRGIYDRRPRPTPEPEGDQDNASR